MPQSAVLLHLPKHRGTGRSVALVEGSIAELEPPETNGEKFILVVAASKGEGSPDVELARRWIDAGASYVCAWGEAAEEVEDTFDHASFLPELGEPLPWTFMTTAHMQESVEEVLWFAFYCAAAPEDLGRALNRVVVVTATPSIAKICRQWVESNAE